MPTPTGEEHVDDYALNRNLEICFEIHKLQKEEAIIFQERGDRYKDLIKTMKTAQKIATKNECELAAWVKQRGKTSSNETESTATDSEVELLEPGGCIQAAKSGNASAPSRQLTFHDLKWKPPEMDEEKALQWKQLAKLDKDMWEDIEHEEERKAEHKDLPVDPSEIDVATISRSDHWGGKSSGVGNVEAMANGLKKDYPKLFSHLNKGTMSKWINKTKWQWLEVMLLNVQNGHTLAGSGQSGILSHYLHVQEEIIMKLKGLRTAGLPINVIIARFIMLAVIQDRVPELLKTFKCSEALYSTGLLAKGHAQLQNSLLMWTTMAWRATKECGSHQVDLVAKDEKQAFTLLVASTPHSNYKGALVDDYTQAELHGASKYENNPWPYWNDVALLVLNIAKGTHVLHLGQAKSKRGQKKSTSPTDLDTVATPPTPFIAVVDPSASQSMATTSVNLDTQMTPSP
ncbi:hypothetical protein V8E55_011277 [Tylopilus felleus]